MENNTQYDGSSSPVRKKNPWNSGVLLALILVVLAYTAGFQMGKKGYTFQPKEFKIVNQGDQPQTVDYQLLWDAIKVVNDKYIERPVNPQKLLYGAVRGAVAAAGDPYTDFFEPTDLSTFKSDLKGEFDGIGAEIGKRNGYIVVVAPLDDTPAQRAGLLAGDIIAQVNAESTTEWSVEETVSKIRGQRGTAVKLTVVREGKDQPLDFNIVRDKIEIKSVKSEIKDMNGKKIAVITVSKFGDDTKQLFDRAVTEAKNQSVQGVVVDLRNNPGGYLNTAVELASNWVKQGDLVVKEERTGKSEDYVGLGNARLNGVKTVVLINGGSASASEILSGALQDHKLGILVGEKSFGKGSVQEIVDLRGGSAVKVTVAKWITPGGKNLNKEGLTPDIEVKLTEEDVAAGKDPQMDKAVEEVTR